MNKQPNSKIQNAEEKQNNKSLFVATDLTFWDTDKPHFFADDVGVDGTCYRRLDPKYYAWLRHKVTCAKQAKLKGVLNADLFAEICMRFNQINQWAKEHLKHDDLKAALQTLSPSKYLPPTMENLGLDYGYGDHGLSLSSINPVTDTSDRFDYLYPPEGDWYFTQKVFESATKKVDAISKDALSKGWSKDQLYQNRGRFKFPCGNDYGLVCFLDDDEHVGEVTPKYIEIVRQAIHQKRILRFHNWNLMQSINQNTTNKEG